MQIFNTKCVAPALLLTALVLPGCMATDAILGDLDHKPTHGSDRYPISLQDGKASVPACGNWKSDMTDTSQNRPYDNLGCAVQHNIAAQLSNPSTIDKPQAVMAKDGNTAVSAVIRQQAAVSSVTLPSNYAYKP